MQSQKFGAFFYFGLLSGFLLLLIGLASLNYLLVSFLLGTLIVCSGLGIIFGAFGSTAKIEKMGEGVVLTGVAAIALALFYVLLNNMDDKYLKVNISGDVKGVDRMELLGEGGYLGAYQNNSYNFVIFDDELKETNLDLFVYEADGSELHFRCIPSSRVIPHLSSGRTIEWEFSRSESAIFDVKTSKKITNSGVCHRSDEILASEFSKPKKTIFSFFHSVYAMDDAAIPSDSAIELIGQLDSGVPHIRREARDALADQGVNAVAPLVNALTGDPTYRTRLGVLVALSEMEKPQNTEIITRYIDDKGLASLIEAVDDRDKTIRIYASDFLIGIKDPRVIDLAIGKYSSVSPDGKFNYVLIVKNTIDDLSEGDRSAVLEQLKTLKSDKTPKINALIDQAVSEKQ